MHLRSLQIKAALARFASVSLLFHISVLVTAVLSAGRAVYEAGKGGQRRI